MCVFVLHVLDYIFSITCSHGERLQSHYYFVKLSRWYAHCGFFKIKPRNEDKKFDLKCKIGRYLWQIVIKMWFHYYQSNCGFIENYFGSREISWKLRESFFFLSLILDWWSNNLKCDLTPAIKLYQFKIKNIKAVCFYFFPINFKPYKFITIQQITS